MDEDRDKDRDKDEEEDKGEVEGNLAVLAYLADWKKNISADMKFSGLQL